MHREKVTALSEKGRFYRIKRVTSATHSHSIAWIESFFFLWIEYLLQSIPMFARTRTAQVNQLWLPLWRYFVPAGLFDRTLFVLGAHNSPLRDFRWARCSLHNSFCFLFPKQFTVRCPCTDLAHRLDSWIMITSVTRERNLAHVIRNTEIFRKNPKQSYRCQSSDSS